jgi:AraC-like DNA-binding protein
VSTLVQHLVAAGSPSQQIAKAVAWLKQNFTRALHVDDLATRTHMSPSTFRQHFRAITGMSPLQFQKQLRLQEARQLMLNQNLDAGNAGGSWAMRAPPSSAASTAGYLALHRSAISNACD